MQSKICGKRRNMETEMREYSDAPFVKRGIAYVIDAIIAVMPAIVMYVIFAGEIRTLAPVYYPAPVIGAVSMVDLPVEVNKSVSIVKDDEGIITTSNHTMTADAMRALSVLVIVFYVGYSAFCTALYDGRTVGKKIMHLRVVTDRETKPLKAYLLREILGKIIINSTVIIPVISVVMAIIMPKKKTIHDFIGGTRVIEE